jgi:hypothetical protein
VLSRYSVSGVLTAVGRGADTCVGAEAGKCVLVGESGEGILFSDLIREKGKVVVVFLRHLWFVPDLTLFSLRY